MAVTIINEIPPSNFALQIKTPINLSFLLSLIFLSSHWRFRTAITSPSIHSDTAYTQLPKQATLLSLLRQSAAVEKKPKSRSSGGLLKMFKLFPLLASSSKIVALLSRSGHRKRFICDHAAIGTIFSHRLGKVSLAIQDDPHSPPAFVIDLPIYSAAFQREMEGDEVRIAFESEARGGRRKKLLGEMVWVVYCNGKRLGYSVRRREVSEEEEQVMRLLKGVSMAGGVMAADMAYLRSRFERVVGSLEDSEAMYMINHEDATSLCAM